MSAAEGRALVRQLFTLPPERMVKGPRSDPEAHKLFDRAYSYRDPGGTEVFQHVRYRLDPPVNERAKTFRYRWRRDAHCVWVNRKPPGADDFLYRLPELYAALRKRTAEPIYWCEGEKDADALATLGVLATSHHQAAAHATEAQAAWLKPARRIVLLADRDVPGAACALHRHRLLRAVGVDPARIRCCVAAEGKDAADHVEAGYDLDDLVPVRADDLYRAAARATPATYQRAGYSPPGEDRTS